MNYDEQYIIVRDRDVIVSKNLQQSLQINDNISEKVTITMDRFYDDIDFDSKQVNFVFRNSNYEQTIINLNTVKTTSDDTLTFELLFTDKLTKVPGWADFVIVVTGDGGYKWQSKQSTKGIFISSNFTSNLQQIPPQYYVDLETYRQEILGYLSLSQSSSNQIQSSATQIETNKQDISSIKPELENKIVISDTLPEVKDRINNGFYLQNLDVVRDGLIFAKTSIIRETIAIPVITEQNFYIYLRFKVSVESLTYILKLNQYNVGIQYSQSKILIVNTENGNILSRLTGRYPLGNDIALEFHKNGNIYTITTSKEVVSVTNSKEKNVGGNSLDYSDYCYIYNRPLTQQEIKYNFDSMGKNKVQKVEKDDGTAYALSALADDIFFKNGSNLENVILELKSAIIALGGKLNV